MTNELEIRINNIKKRIEQAALKAKRKTSDITIVAVTKTVDADTALAAFNLGLNNLGENRVQELKNKIQHIPGAYWHMIGRLQTNKVKDVVGQVRLIHSLDRWNLAEAINKRGVQLGIEVPVLMELNIAGEEQKAGFHPDDVQHFLDSVGQLKSIRVYGFMTVAPQVKNVEETRPVFRELSWLQDKFKSKIYSNVDLKYLSMGMTQDFDVAIEEGANIVRIGSAFFG